MRYTWETHVLCTFARSDFTAQLQQRQFQSLKIDSVQCLRTTMKVFAASDRLGCHLCHIMVGLTSHWTLSIDPIQWFICQLLSHQFTATVSQNSTNAHGGFIKWWYPLHHPLFWPFEFFEYWKKPGVGDPPFFEAPRFYGHGPCCRAASRRTPSPGCWSLTKAGIKHQSNQNLVPRMGLMKIHRVHPRIGKSFTPIHWYFRLTPDYSKLLWLERDSSEIHPQIFFLGGDPMRIEGMHVSVSSWKYDEKCVVEVG